MGPHVNHLSVRVFSDINALALAVADRVSAVAGARQSEGRPVVLGLAAGKSPLAAYHALVLRVRAGKLDLSRCAAFCLDEYYPIHPEDPRSFTRQMSGLAAELGIPQGNLRCLDGGTPRRRIALHCREYEDEIRLAGGIDFQILGIGRSGHIGFNEPGTARESRTGLVRLHQRTRQDAASSFGGLDHVPQEAITMGIETILKAREIALIALGEQKASIVRRLVKEPPSPAVPASFLQSHERATVYLDGDAAGLLAESNSERE